MFHTRMSNGRSFFSSSDSCCKSLSAVLAMIASPVLVVAGTNMAIPWLKASSIFSISCAGFTGDSPSCTFSASSLMWALISFPARDVKLKVALFPLKFNLSLSDTHGLEVEEERRDRHVQRSFWRAPAPPPPPPQCLRGLGCVGTWPLLPNPFLCPPCRSPLPLKAFFQPLFRSVERRRSKPQTINLKS